MDDAYNTAAQWLSQWRTASLATVGEESLPRACNIQFAWIEQQLIFVSSPDSAHAQHIAKSQYVALTVYAHIDTPPQIHGVQLHGTACGLVGDDRESAIAAYLNVLELSDTPQWRQKIAKQMVYAIDPFWIRVIDNRQGFGFKQEWSKA